MTDREHQLLDLQASDLPQEIGLVLYRVLGSREPYLTVDLGSRSVMARRDLIEILAPFILEAAKLDILIAHHVGVGCQSAFDRIDRVAYHSVPILIVQGDNLHPATIFAGNIGRDLNILLGRTIDVAILIFHAYTDIENRRVITRLLQLMNHDGAVDPAGN